VHLFSKNTEFVLKRTTKLPNGGLQFFATKNQSRLCRAFLSCLFFQRRGIAGNKPSQRTKKVVLIGCTYKINTLSRQEAADERVAGSAVAVTVSIQEADGGFSIGVHVLTARGHHYTPGSLASRSFADGRFM